MNKEHKSKDEALQDGEVLGLGRSPVPKSPADPVTEFDEESIARRRARSRGDDEIVEGTDLPRSKGATGIDMGAGGSGTDVE